MDETEFPGNDWTWGLVRRRSGCGGAGEAAGRTTGAAPKPLVNLVHQSRWDKFMCPDLIAGRWTAGNSSLKHFGWADLAAAEVKETVATWRVKGFVEAISFWRDRVVLPARDLGVLLPKTGFGE